MKMCIWSVCSKCEEYGQQVFTTWLVRQSTVSHRSPVYYQQHLDSNVTFVMTQSLTPWHITLYKSRNFWCHAIELNQYRSTNQRNLFQPLWKSSITWCRQVPLLDRMICQGLSTVLMHIRRSDAMTIMLSLLWDLNRSVTFVSHVMDLVKYDPANLSHDLGSSIQHASQNLLK